MLNDKDYSTLNIEQLERLPVYKLPPSYHVQQSTGNGCAGDPPGYPTYFTRSVYTSHGHLPPRGPRMVIGVPGVEGLRVVEHSNDWNIGVNSKGCEQIRAARLHALWKPLPIDHPRVQAWIRYTYSHFAHCYVDAERLENGRPGTLIYPIPSYKLKTFRDNFRWSEEYRAAAKAEVEAFNAQELNHARAIVANPANHRAVVCIRKYYPEHQPDLELITHSSKSIIELWWETDAKKPTPETCRPRWGKHPINGSWCQWCGWKAVE